MAPWANIFHRLRRAMKEGVRLGLVALSVHFVRFARQMPITMGRRYAAGKSLNACTTQDPQNFLKGAQSARRLRRLRAGLRRPRVQKVKLLLHPRHPDPRAQKRR